jgi:hypothetical protein
MTTPSLAKENKERREVLENDRKVREQQGTTFLDHARAAALDTSGGRFANAQGNQFIVGATPLAYPTLPESSPWHGPDPVGREPPLGFAIDAMPELAPPTGVSAVSPPVAPDDPAHAPSGPASVSERAGSSSSEDATNE